jgi:nucleotide-binding universal stress UspA family protein
MFKHILIPTDGTPIANKAAKAGIALAHRLGAKVTVYFAIEDLQPIYIDGFTFSRRSSPASMSERVRQDKSASSVKGAAYNYQTMHDMYA